MPRRAPDTRSTTGRQAVPTLDEVRRRLELLARRLEEAHRYHETGRAVGAGDVDFPEGAITVRMSHTLARVWTAELRRCARAVERAAR